jgi:hypothetical protein
LRGIIEKELLPLYKLPWAYLQIHPYPESKKYAQIAGRKN